LLLSPGETENATSTLQYGEAWLGPNTPWNMHCCGDALDYFIPYAVGLKIGLPLHVAVCWPAVKEM